MDDTLSLIINSIKLSRGMGRDFTELELSKEMGINKKSLEKLFAKPEFSRIFRKTNLKKFKCPFCGGSAERILANTIICGTCGKKVDEGLVGSVLITPSLSGLELCLKSYITKAFKSNRYKVIESTNDFALLKRNNDAISIVVKGGNLKLNDFYTIRGWNNTTNSGIYILFGFSADTDLIAMSQKDPRCILFHITDFENIDPYKRLFEVISDRKSLISTNRGAEELAGFKFGELELLEVKNKFDRIMDELPILALQKGSESSSSQGKKFQNYVISLLNLTLFRSKLLSGNNEPDGLMQLFYNDTNKKPSWIPIEVKTFKQIGEPKFNIKNISRQLDKYSNALEKPEIAQYVRTPAFLSIAYDFDLDTKKSNSIIDQLESDHQIKYSFMPLSSLTRIIKLFMEKQISIIHAHKIEEFISKNRFITSSSVDQLFKELDKDQSSSDSLLKQFRQQVSLQGI